MDSKQDQIDAARWRAMRETLVACDFDYQDSGMTVAVLQVPDNTRFSAGAECMDAIADALIARSAQ